MKSHHHGIRFAALAALLMACACDNVLDFGELTVQVWTPETLNSGSSGDLLADASSVEVTLDVDGALTTERFDDATQIRIEGASAATAGSDVRVALQTTGTDLDDAFGQSERVRVAENEMPVATLVLAPPRAVHRLFDAIPDARSAPAACANDEGVLIAGGFVPNTTPPLLSAGSLFVSRSTRDVVEGPALVDPRFAAGCALLDDGTTFLVGGCTDDGVALGTAPLLRADGPRIEDTFVASAPLGGSGSVCGAAATSTGDALVIQYGDTVEWRDADGNRTALVTLPQARFFAELAAIGERAFVSGGFTDVLATTLATGTLDVTVEGATELLTDGPVAVSGEHVVQLQADQLAQLTGERETVATLSANAAAVEVSTLAANADGAVLALARDGDEIVIVDGDDVRVRDVSPPRPGGRVVAEPGGAFFIVGGGVAGVAALIP